MLSKVKLGVAEVMAGGGSFFRLSKVQLRGCIIRYFRPQDSPDAQRLDVTNLWRCFEPAKPPQAYTQASNQCQKSDPQRHKKSVSLWVDLVHTILADGINSRVFLSFQVPVSIIYQC